MIRSVQIKDAQAIADIYNYYILHSIVTFEEEVIDAKEIEKRILAVTAKFSWIVYEENGEIIGYAYGSEWRSRFSYRHTVESTVYLKHNTPKKGIGTLLYKELIKQLTSKNFHVILGCISLPNEASEKFHEKLGFKKIAHFHEVGYKFNNWVDVGFWELIVNK
ncbi:GNAT family N-acetyltransferase [Lutibacter holmesii]|uniref:GNAT family N-acetyltransferase n=1 Tax=Lutibacter holmesii TaxID=1137985 RepID=A0ABW3WLL6_9FLAO